MPTVRDRLKEQYPQGAGPWEAGVAAAGALPFHLLEQIWGSAKEIPGQIQNAWDASQRGDIQGTAEITAPIVAEAAGTGWGAGALGAAKAGIDPALLAASFGGKRHKRFLPNLWHGVQEGNRTINQYTDADLAEAISAGARTKRDSVLQIGFKRGRSETGKLGTSLTPDPNVSYGSFSSGDLDNVLRVNPNVSPEEIYNISPAEYLARDYKKLLESGVKIGRKAQGPYNEAEYYAFQDTGGQAGLQPRMMNAYERNTLIPQWEAIGNQPSTANVWNIEDWARSPWSSPAKMGAQQYLFEDLANAPNAVKWARSSDSGRFDYPYADKYEPWRFGIINDLAPHLQNYNDVRYEMAKYHDALKDVGDYRPQKESRLYNSAYAKKQALEEQMRRVMADWQIPGKSVTNFHRGVREGVGEELSSLSNNMDRQNVRALKDWLNANKKPSEMVPMLKELLAERGTDRSGSFKPVLENDTGHVIDWSWHPERKSIATLGEESWRQLAETPEVSVMEKFWDETEPVTFPAKKTWDEIYTKNWGAPSNSDFPSTWKPPYSDEELAALNQLWSKHGPNTGDPPWFEPNAGAVVQTWLKSIGL